jgi:protein-L-isoaspartate(D-aspartate) O-methyltransferase
MPLFFTGLTDMDVELARSKMLNQQVRAWEVLDPRVLDVFATVPRERFVPEAYRNLAFADTEIPLGHGEAMMAPKLEGRLLQALAIQPEDTVLEVGTGSGFLAACLARLGRSVLSVDILGEFTDQAGRRLAAIGAHNVQLETRDSATLDWLPQRYDCIAVTGSLPELHASFRQQLAVGGRLFAVVGDTPVMDALLVTRVAERDWSTQHLFETELRPLRNARRTPRFAL